MDINFGIKDIIDIILVAILLYQSYRLMKGTGAGNIFVGVITFIIFWFLVTRIFQMELLGAILNSLISVGAIALVIIFQNEIRRFFSRIGSHKNWRIAHYFEGLFKLKKNEGQNTFPIMKVVIACRNMSRTKTGALIIIARNASLNEYISSGELLDAKINTRLIENIFYKNTPLHDGAMIIADEKIASAAAILPVSQSTELPKRLGLRHRAALGVSERTDAIAIIISEETGNIAMAIGGKLHLNLTAEQLERTLSAEIEF